MRALIVVDMQNDFVDKRGALFVEDAPFVIPRINEEVKLHNLVVLTACNHPEDDPSFKDYGGPWPAHCLRGSWGAWFHPRLEPTVSVADMILRKVGYSAFFQNGMTTGLHEYLRANWVDSLVIAGVALDYCVGETAKDAARLGYEVTLPLHLTAAVVEGAEGRVAEELRREGVRVT